MTLKTKKDVLQLDYHGAQAVQNPLFKTLTQANYCKLVKRNSLSSIICLKYNKMDLLR